MKKIIAMLLIAAGAYSYANAQGLVEVFNIGAANANSTNTGVSAYNNPPGTQAGGTGGATAVGGTFYYALLIAATGGPAPSANPTSGAWSLGLMATNYAAAGGIRAAGGAAGTSVAGWAGGTTDYIELVGWSASLGSTWSQVEAEVASGNYLANGFFGVSSVGQVTAASAPSPATSIFGGTGLSSGITMFSVTPLPTPEPGSIALAGLGGMALLALRRKK
jgi:hypothetical protein